MTVTIKRFRTYLLITLLLAAGFGVAVAPKTAEAACAANNANLGSVTGSFTVPTTGTYRVWSRIQPDSSNAANNSYSLEVDNGTVTAGSATCNITVGDATIAAPPAWTWVDYQGGNTASKINMQLTAGTHTYTAYGREAGVVLDRIIFSADTSCVPSNGPRDTSVTPVVDPGDNCASSVTPAPDPVTSITSPAAGATLSGANSVITADASSGVTKVEFYIDSQIIGTPDTSSPYSVTLNTTSYANGTHSLTSKAYDAAGHTGTSAPVSINISNTVTDTTPPTVSISAPQIITSITTINAAVADAGGISKVEFYIDGSLLGTDTVSPYSFQLNPISFTNGAHTLTAKAYDNANNSATSTPVNTTINNPDVTAPSVLITAPLNNTTVNGTIVINADASDAVAVAGVEFYLDGALKSTVTISPYSYTLDTKTLTNAVHTIVVKAFDSSSNISLPATLTLTVNNAVAPKSGDINGDGKIDTADLFILLPNFGKTVPKGTKGDCNGDGVVDTNDLFILLAQFGK